VQPRAAVLPDSSEEREADTEVIDELGTLTGKFGLLNLEVTPGDHAEPAWQIPKFLSTALPEDDTKEHQ